MTRPLPTYCAIALASMLGTMPARAAPPLSGDDLAPVHKLANTMKARLQCTPVEPGSAPPATNVSAAAEYAQVAGMYAFTAQHYPADQRGDRVSQINDLIDDAALAYERAYDCAPGRESAFYLLRAIELIDARAQHLIQVEHHDADNPHVQELFARRDRLRAKLPPEPQCPVCLQCTPCPTPPPPPTGYRGLHAERLALSIGLGGGQAWLGRGVDGRLALLTLRTAFGPRFVLGARKRHILGAGIHYALQAVIRYSSDSIPVAPTPHPSAIHQAGPYLDYTFAPHRDFSVQGHLVLSISAGIVWFDDAGTLRNYSISAVTPGGGVALCTLRGVLCARMHAYGSVLVDTRPFTGYDVTLGFDVFRLIDRSPAVAGTNAASRH